ncbi:hypothetical protein L3Q82_023571 [Scortum barcoo]|uniref:Uncharacterized protein n=1 Tax=Scortum barcoo TaxID=214431 RepID=A0ACB8WVJ1_9TELE|nr:hypothetical protein L3Q82_023571 [Scortum barcoo]
MKSVGLVVLLLCLHQRSSSSAQECPSTHDLLNSLRQVEKMLAVHEASYQQGLRSLRKKMSALHNSTMAIFKTGASCPKPEPPAHGRRLGRVFAVGHEVHFLCKPGYELIGPCGRECLNSTGNSLASFSPAAPSSSLTVSAALSSSSSSSSASSPSPLSSLSPTSSPSSSVRPSHCTHFLGSTRCTCDVGFTISGRDNNICTDIVDECHLFPLGQPGRPALRPSVREHSWQFPLLLSRRLRPRRGRSQLCRSEVKDIDECESRTHNCTADQACVNTYGGFQCVRVECPRIKNATYIKTSIMRCERNPCMLGDKGCSQAPNSISFHFLSVVSNMSAPRVLFRVSAARVLGDTLRFGLAGGRGRGHFSVQRSGRQTGTLLLVTPVQGPATLEAEVEMSELERHALLGRYLTKVTLFVSPHDF